MNKNIGSSSNISEEDGNNEFRRGPWSVDEDTLLIHYISHHGEGRWNLLAKRSGLKRTGKSCRLRWLNYLNPDVKRGNLSPQEQLLILDLHSKWGNRWSRIAQHLPGRTDNEIKNYWRTQVQKQARHLNIDANSTAFKQIIQYLWIPKLIETIHSCPSSSENLPQISSTTQHPFILNQNSQSSVSLPQEQTQLSCLNEILNNNKNNIMFNLDQNSDTDNYFMTNSSISSPDHESMNISQLSRDCSGYNINGYNTIAKDWPQVDHKNGSHDMVTLNPATTSASRDFDNLKSDWIDNEFSGCLWNDMDGLW